MSKFALGWIRPRFARCRILGNIFLSWARKLPPPELAAKDLGAQEGKDAEKEKEENEEGDDRLNRVDQGAEQVLK